MEPGAANSALSDAIVTGGGHGACGGHGLAVACAVAALVLAAWWFARSRYSVADCSRFSDPSVSRACAQMNQACRGNRPCMNAVAHCLPAMADPTPGRVHSCARAVAEVPPADAAVLISSGLGLGNCGTVAADTSPIAPAAARAQAALASKYVRAAAPVLPWAVQVAAAAPQCAATNPQQFMGVAGALLSGIQNQLGRMPVRRSAEPPAASAALAMPAVSAPPAPAHP